MEAVMTHNVKEFSFSRNRYLLVIKWGWKSQQTIDALYSHQNYKMPNELIFS